MQIKIPILTAIVVLTTVLAIPLATHPVVASPGHSVDDPANIWYPYGPVTVPKAGEGPTPVTKILYTYHADEKSEFNDFIAGKIDLTDWQQPKSNFGPFDRNPDFQLSPAQGQFGDYGIYLNGLGTIANGAWGCDWTVHAPYTDKSGATHPIQTYSSACGINMRQGFQHLIDKPAFSRDVLGGAGQALADPSPPAKDPSGSSLATQCSWDPMFPTCISAYNLRDDPGGFATPGSPDFCAAADHMIAAGIATGKTAGSCVLTGVNPGVSTTQMIGMIRSDDPRRNALGHGFVTALNQLMGRPVVAITEGTIDVLGAVVFTDPPESPINDWDFYTFGYGLGGPYPSHMYGLYYSTFASDQCGGPNDPEPNNPTFVCVAALDNAVIDAQSTTDVSAFKAATLAAFDEYGKRAIGLESYSPATRIAALTSVSALVNLRGNGYYNGYTLAYAHKNPNYTPVDPKYAFGAGDASTLRYGQKSASTSLNPFHTATVWDYQLFLEVYDSLFNASPVQLSNVYDNMCVRNASFPCTTPDQTTSPGNTIFHIQLRQNLRWQDGQPVDAKDVAFSILGERDFASNLGGSFSLVTGVKVYSSTQLDVFWKGQSLTYPIFMEAVIIPRHIWECTTDNTCSDPGINPKGTHAQYVAAGVLEPSTVKRSTSYDAVTNGALIGSGQFACISVFPEDLGKLGTGCTKNADGSRGGQAIPIGGSALLQAYDFTGKAGNTDPFLQYIRSYNANWGTGSGTAAQSGQFQEWLWASQNSANQVTIANAGAVAPCWHATAPNTNCPAAAYNYWLRSSLHSATANEISTEVAVVNSHIDEGWVTPFAWSNTALENLVSFGST